MGVNADLWAVTEAEVGDVMTPVFITCDPARDTPEVVSIRCALRYQTYSR